MSGLFAGAKVLPVAGEERIRVGHHLLGRVVDGLLQPLDGRPLEAGGELVSLFSAPPNPLTRQPIVAPLDVGVRAYQWSADLLARASVWVCLPVLVWVRVCCWA